MTVTNEHLGQLFGDVGAAVIWILMHDEALNEVFPNLRVAGSRRGYTRGMNWIEVNRRGGIPPIPEAVDYARIDIDCYALTSSQCHDMAQLARVAVVRMSRGQFIGFGVTISHVGNELGLTSIPDPNTGDERCFQSLGVTAPARPDHPGPPDVEDSP